MTPSMLVALPLVWQLLYQRVTCRPHGAYYGGFGGGLGCISAWLRCKTLVVLAVAFV